MRVSAVFFGLCTPDVLTSYISFLPRLQAFGSVYKTRNQFQLR